MVTLCWTSTAIKYEVWCGLYMWLYVSGHPRQAVWVGRYQHYTHDITPSARYSPSTGQHERRWSTVPRQPGNHVSRPTMSGVFYIFFLLTSSTCEKTVYFSRIVAQLWEMTQEFSTGRRIYPLLKFSKSFATSRLLFISAGFWNCPFKKLLSGSKLEVNSWLLWEI